MVGDIEQLSVTRPFHQVACIGVLHHCPNPAKALGRLARALEVGGVMQLATYSRLSVHTWLARARKLPTVPTTLEQELTYNFHLRCTKEELADLCGCGPA